MAALAKLFLEDNTPRLPAEVERGFPKLFSTFEAKGPQHHLGRASGKSGSGLGADAIVRDSTRLRGPLPCLL